VDIVRKPDNKEFTTVYSKNNCFEAVREAVNKLEYDNYRREWEKAASLLEVPKYPIQLDFELNNSCNYSCPMCTYRTEARNNKGARIWFDFDIYKQIIDEGVIRGLKAVRLNYINEPLMRPDIKDFISYARKAGILDMYFSTNGSLLTEKVSRELIESGLLRLQVSIDATTKETYDKIRPGRDFHKVLDNVLRFLQIRNDMGATLPTLRVNYVKTETNAHELQQFVKYWEGKADAIGIQDFIDIGSSCSDKHVDNNMTEFKCSQPFCHLTIRYNGDMLPCCAFYGAQMPIARIKTSVTNNSSAVGHVGHAGEIMPGELPQMTINEAWNSTVLVTLRQMHKNGEYWKNPVCKKCVLSTSH